MDTTRNAPPLLEVMADYNKLVIELKVLFPNAIIGLFNIPPRKYEHISMYHRINAFNYFMLDLLHYNDVNMIHLYWEFCTPTGYLSPDMFHDDFLHFSRRAVGVLSERIVYFQQQTAINVDTD